MTETLESSEKKQDSLEFSHASKPFCLPFERMDLSVCGNLGDPYPHVMPLMFLEMSWADVLFIFIKCIIIFRFPPHAVSFSKDGGKQTLFRLAKRNARDQLSGEQRSFTFKGGYSYVNSFLGKSQVLYPFMKKYYLINN